MSSHKPTRPEDSTAIRQRRDGTATPISSDPTASAASLSDPIGSGIEDAQTVIRGSSRAASPHPDWDNMNRSPAAVAKVLLNKSLNHFHLQEMIGGGGMGAVFRAHDEQLDRTVAIKVIPFVSDDPDLKRRFRNEAKSAAKLDHPHIARVFDVGSHDRWHYIVFEYISGTNIRDKVTRHGVMTIDDSVFYVSQLAEAIGHAASRGIVHRDIKPSNVLICDDDQIKLVDMGLARSDSFDVSEDMTASGVTLGTFDYISPEQARDPRDADLRSDLYSLGCTLYFMLTGHPPYPGGTMLQKLLSHGNSPPPDARLLRDEVSDDLYAVLNRMLAKAPEDRYQSVADLLADLHEVASRENLTRTLGIGGTVVQPPHPARLWAVKHLPWVAAASLLLLTTLTLQLISLTTGNDMTVPQPATATILDPQTQRIYSAGIPNNPRPTRSSTNRSSTNDTSQPGKESPGVQGTEPATDSIDTTGDDAARPPEMIDDFPIPPELTGMPATGFPADAARPFRINEDRSPETESTTDGADVAPAVTINSIRVIGRDGPTSEMEDPARLETRSLASAFELAEKHNVDLIEITAKQIYSGPLDVTRDSLQVRSTVESTTIIFETPVSPSTGPVELITVGSNRVEFEKINFVWRIPASVGTGGSLFGLTENKRVRLNTCTITIENPLNQKNIFAFNVRTRPQTDRNNADNSLARSATFDGLPLVSVGLSDVVIRGEIGLMRLDQAVELQLRWENGLLAINETAIETAGSSIETARGTDGIRLSLNDVTAFVPNGLVKMTMDRQETFPVRIDRDARRSLFVVNPDSSHLQFSGLAVIDETTEFGDLVLISGESNAYHTQAGRSGMLIRLSDRQETRAQIDLDDVIESPREWCSERSSRLRVRWSDPNFAEILPSQMTAADFAQDGELGSGFLAEQLPELPTLRSENL